MTQPTTPFRYKVNYVAAWPDEASEAMLLAYGISRRVHMTTFVDCYGQLSSLTPYPWTGTKEARIEKVVEWPVGTELYLIAEMADCAWSQEINGHYLAQGPRENQPHRAHITLAKRIKAGTAAAFQTLVGQVLRFDRHGREIDDRPPYMAPSDVVLRDWQVTAVGEFDLLVKTPPLRSGFRDFHLVTKGSGNDVFYMLANAMLQAKTASSQTDADALVESVTLALLGKSEDPAPGVNWQCTRQWHVNDVREQVRLALDKVGITKSLLQGHIPMEATPLSAQLLAPARKVA